MPRPRLQPKYFDIGGIRFDIYEESEEADKKEPIKISESYFGFNPMTPMVISTRERLLGPFSYQEIQR